MSTRHLNFALMFFCCCLISLNGLAQSGNPPAYSEMGLPFIQNFSPNDYGGAHSQNWAIVQDLRGMMYFGNGVCVLEYDGVSWREITIPNVTPVRSMAIDEHGRIFVGARGEIGYLAPDSIGQLTYVSLVDQLPDQYRNFSNVWCTLATSHGIYFAASKYLFRWQSEASASQKNGGGQSGQYAAGMMRVWETRSTIYSGAVVEDTVFIWQPELGLIKLVNDSLQAASGGASQFAHASIHLMLPFRDKTANGLQRVLIGSRKQGLFTYDHTAFQPLAFEPEVEKFLAEAQLTDGAVLQDGTFALATLHSGVAIIEQQGGRLRKVLNKAAGLRDESVRAIYPDHQGNLWLALNNGIARVEYPAPFTYYSERSHLTGSVRSLARHQGRLYAATTQNLCALQEAMTGNEMPVFREVKGVEDPGWSLLAMDQTLLASASHGLYAIQQEQVVEISNQGRQKLSPSRYHPNLVFAGLPEGLAVLKSTGGQWRIAARVAGVSGDVRTIVEEGPGIFWLGKLHEGFSRVRIPNLDSLASATRPAKGVEIPATVENFHQSNGLKTGTGRVFFVNQRLVFATNQGMRRFDHDSNMFLRDATFDRSLADSTRMVSRVIEDQTGKIWIKSTWQGVRETGVAIPGKDGGYIWDNKPFRRIADWGSVFVLYPDPEQTSILWIGGPEGLLRYDSSVTKNYSFDFKALVRRVVVSGDSVTYGGFPIGNSAATLDYSNNFLRFEYAALSYEETSRNRYQVFLEGFDKGWSKWTSETQKDYTNLPEGDYRFRVRAENTYRDAAAEGVYNFTILPPWYRSWWAYLMYGILFAGAFSAIVTGYNKWRTGQLRQRTRELERTVAERTNELVEMNLQLKEADNLKSQFFANISHEFRTPLALILGQIENVLPDLRKKHNIMRLDMAVRNGRRLLQLINQLLDLAKFDAQQMTLRTSLINIVPLVRHLTGAFESLAEKRNIALKFESVENEVLLYSEQDKLEKVVNNLLSNAIKFTPKGGCVLVRVEKELHQSGATEQPGPDDLSGDAKIIVQDSGIGIPNDRMPQVFNRFFQVDSASTREFEGTGIGLALTKELVQIHGGGISVESTEGVGSTFIVNLPLGKAHLKPEEIAASPVQSRVNFNEPDTPEGVEASPGADFEILPSYREDLPARDDTGAQKSKKKSEIVLIVEDNDDMRTYLRESIEGSYRIIEAANGEEGFIKAQKYIPDLIVTDVMMPVKDGYELTFLIRKTEITSHIPIIMLTAKASEEDKFEGLEKGVDAYLTKPFNKKELEIRTRKLIELRKQLRKQVGAKAILMPSQIEGTSMDQQFLAQVQMAIEEGMGDEEFSVDDLALGLALGKRQLQRKLKALTDASPQQCIRVMRLERARQMLEQNSGTVSEIAFEVGYGNLSAFSLAFRQHFGKTPSQLRNK